MRRCLPVFANSVFWNDFPCVRLVTLNREKALNSLNVEMLRSLRRAYMEEPHSKGDAAVYVVKGAGERSFCAGGDAISVTTSDSYKELFYTEYQINYHMLTMPNPQVSLWNGYVMGGGVGVSIHGRYRVASERALFAMPETLIGMFPDVGASWFLPRLPFRGLGLYLGLTGARLKGADVVHTGLATHYVPSEKFNQLEESLCQIDDPSKVEPSLEEFAVKQLPQFTLEPHCKLIEDIFTLKDTTTVEGIIDALSADGSDFAKNALDTLSKMSPTALCVALEMQRRGAKMTDPADVFRMEYAGALRSRLSHDSPEGVRALLIDKTKDPKWKPERVADVTKEIVESYFKPVGPEMHQWHPTKPF
ncbi:enoyl-CoA hydratase/isomerase family protein [Trypanosoma theileri]|uniref:3-hydroxyisobutyryl-CoA hydrolase n=1 Tax=Trypanosoma theileri TaxID=67003 RepID=A0A1X0NTE8_9TRYP|nr:enoyl-CoA hydratase/isomerase family protein [Trypanosoma theileri]ORC87459.1 enoyl-CoA hydratase/isomerase family protein [Trypanosoma theileri]